MQFACFNILVFNFFLKYETPVLPVHSDPTLHLRVEKECDRNEV
jgi:hypothetical protein